MRAHRPMATGHILIRPITVDPRIRLTFNLVLNAAVPQALTVGYLMQWSLKQSQIQYQHQ